MMNTFDGTLFHWFNAFAGQSDLVDSVIFFNAEILGFVLLGALFLFLVLPRLDLSISSKTVRMVKLAIVSGLAARFGPTELIRFFYDKPRPFQILEGINQVVTHTAGSAFPSGHAAFFFALAAVVYFYKPRLSGLFFVGATIISISRVVAGIHWPLDILAGAAVGIFTAWALLLKKLNII
jgi:undecaprenyl-diphosphatase